MVRYPKKLRLNIARFFLLSLGIFILPHNVLAQTNGQSISGSNANEVLPSLQSSADLELPDGRNITIHRDANIGSIGSRAIYFHRPIFAFIQNPLASDSNIDHPLIYDKVEMDNNVYINLRLILSTPEFRELARAAVIEEDPTVYQINSTVQEREIDVRPWPLKLLRLEVYHRLTGASYGVSIPKSLRTSGDTIDVVFKFPVEKYDLFLDNLKNDQIEFSPSYTFNNAIVAFAQSATKISGEVSASISNALQSSQIEEGKPIFQADVQKLKNSLQQTITTTIRGTDISVLAHIKPQSITEQILKPIDMTFEEISKDKNLLAKVEAYLAPIVRKMSKDNDETTELNDKTVDTKKQTTKVGYGKTGPDANVELSDEQVKTLENKHKIVFKQKESKDVLEAHSIEINYVREGWQNSLVDIFQTIYLATGSDASFSTDSPIRASFTKLMLNESISSESIIVSPYSRVPRGTSLLSFRADIPKGWIALDGSSNWPSESWVPKHLQGKPVPDMRGAFARGAKSSAEIGKVHNSSKITIPQQILSLKASSLVNTTLYALEKKPPKSNRIKGNIKEGVNYYFGRGYNPINELQPPYVGSDIVPVIPFNPVSKDTTLTVNSQTLELNTDDTQPNNISGQWIMRVQ